MSLIININGSLTNYDIFTPGEEVGEVDADIEDILDEQLDDTDPLLWYLGRE